MMAYGVLFLWCFLAASLVPVSSEPYFVALVLSDKILFWPLLVAVTGNILGGTTTFLLGRAGKEMLDKQRSKRQAKRYARADQLIKRWGAVAMLASWVPFLGDIIVGLGGAWGLPIASSLFWMSVGKFARYLVLGWIALKHLSLSSVYFS